MKKIFDYPSPLWRLRSTVGFLMVVGSVPPAGIYLLLRGAFGASQEWMTWYIRSWMMFVLKAVGLTVEVIGAENHDPTLPSLVISNHQSLFDIPAAFYALGGNLRMVAKKELFQIPIFGHCMHLAGFIPVDRSNRGSGREATRLIGERMKEGVHVWVAPEGTRSPDGQLKEFKKGSFSVALDNALPVQPIVVLDSWRACPKGSLLPRPGTVIHVRVLPRVEPAEMAQLRDRGELSQLTRARMLEVFSGTEFTVESGEAQT